MVLPFAVIAVVLAADFLLVLRRGHDEWRDGDSFSRTTGWLIASLYLGIVALFAYAVLWHPWALDVPVALAAVVGSLLIVAGTLLALPGVAPFRSVRHLYGVERGELITTGIYRYSRNPQYVGIGLVLVGAAVAARSPLAMLVVAAYSLGVRAWLVIEERHLSAAFGAAYDRYRRQAPRFFGFPSRR